MHIVIIGDSIAQGLGALGSSYADHLLQWANSQCAGRATLANMAYTAFQVTDSASLLSFITLQEPDVVILAHGITEAIVRPTARAMRFVPRRWQGKGMLDPRPYFSRRLLARLGQRLDSGFRWRLKTTLMRLFGGRTWMSESDFHTEITKLITDLLNQTQARIVLVTHCGVDERFFPGSTAMLDRYKADIQEIAVATGCPSRVQVVDPMLVLRRWEDYLADHFHPNSTGHEAIAQSIIQVLAESSLISEKQELFSVNAIHS